MRIRLWTAFASNNSGSYTIVGYFRSLEAARAVAEELTAIVREHDAFMDKPEAEMTGVEPPFQRWVREHGLSLDSERLALDDDWPQHGPAPEVTLVGTQVLVHASYTVTLPRTFGELFYRRGGRVQVELDHAHESLIAQFMFWIPNHWERQRREEAAAKLAAFQKALATEVLPPLIEWSPEYRRKPIEPAWGHNGWGVMELGVVFPDLTRGVAGVSRAAEAHGVSVRLRVVEAMHGSDPLAPMRGQAEHAPGAWQAVLWDAKEARVPALKVLREITGLELAEARERLADLPCVVLDRVGRDTAEEAAAKLREIGADAEAVRITAPQAAATVA